MPNWRASAVGCLSLLLSLICGALPAVAQFNGISGIYALNTQTFGLFGTPTILTGGARYSVNDTITLSCPGNDTPITTKPILTVTAVDTNGMVTAVTLTNPGFATAIPSSGTAGIPNGVCNFVQGYTSGSGTGATFYAAFGFNAANCNGSYTLPPAAAGILGGVYAQTGYIGATGLGSLANISPTGTPSTSTYLRGDLTWATVSAGSITFPNQPVTNATSGGVPYFPSTTSMSSSGILIANAIVIGGGAGAPPTTTTTNATALSALANAPGATGGLTLFSGVLGTPTNLTLTNATGLPLTGITATGTPSSTTYLRGDWTWATISGGVSLSTPQTWTAAQTYNNSDFLLLGSSTGATTFTSLNTTATNYTLSFPAVTDTIATLGANQTFSGAITHTGALNATASAPGAGPAANTTTIFGGTAVPTVGTNSGVLFLGGYYPVASIPTLSNGQGSIYTSSTSGYGLIIQGSNSYPITFMTANASIAAQVQSGGLFAVRNLYNWQYTRKWDDGSSPTWNAGFGGTTTVGTSNGTRAFQVTIPASPTGSTGTVNLGAATTNWNCYANDTTNPGTVVVAQTGWASNTATFTAYSRTTGAAVTWTAADVIEMSCSGL